MRVRGNTKVENTLSGRITREELDRWQVEQYIRSTLALPKEATLTFAEDETDDVLFTAAWGGMGERPETEIPARPPMMATLDQSTDPAALPSAPAPR